MKLNTRIAFHILALCLALSACSGSKEEKKQETVNFPPSADGPVGLNSKASARAKLPENVRKLMEREDALTAKRKANPNMSDKELYGPMIPPPIK